MPFHTLPDIFLCLLAAAGACALLRLPSRPAVWGFSVLATVLLVTEIVYRGLHWQMFPAYTVLGLCVVSQVSGRRLPRRGWARLLIAGLVVAAAGSLVLSYALPLFALPRPSGAYAVGVRTEHWTDPATQRQLAVQIWYPAEPVGSLARYARLRELKPKFIYFHWIRTNAHQDAPVVRAAQPFPVLLFSHMWGGRRTQDTFLTEDLASHGYIVVAVDHPGNAARVELSDGSVLHSDRADALDRVEATGFEGIRKIWSDELLLWTADNEFTLGCLAANRAPWLAGRADMQRVGAFGHSFGGSASMALLGLDPRVRSALNFDGWTLEGLAHRTAEPVMFVYEAREAGMAGGMPTGQTVDDRLERTDRQIVDRSLAAGGGTRAYVLGTQHADFTDATLYSPMGRLTYTGPIRPERMREITRGLTLGFFDRTLKGQGQVPAFAEVQTTSVDREVRAEAPPLKRP